MSRTSRPSDFLSLFQTALEEFKEQTGTSLTRHSLGIKLNSCNDVDSIHAALQDQARAFREFRGDDGNVMGCLKRVVYVVYNLSTSGVLGEDIGLVG
jgi:hypothetical protein